MGETPIQYTRRPDDHTLKEWRRRSRRSANMFAGLIDDGTDAANEQARATLKAAERIKTRSEEMKIIFLSSAFHDHYIESALKIGASGYLHKGEPTETLAMAIREVAAGGSYFSDEIRDRIVEKDGSYSLAEGAKMRSKTLTDREVEVLRYLARGLTKKEIAGLMHLSPKTIESHCARLMDKLDIHDRVELARYAIREGLTEA